MLLLSSCKLPNRWNRISTIHTYLRCCNKYQFGCFVYDDITSQLLFTIRPHALAQCWLNIFDCQPRFLLSDFSPRPGFSSEYVSALEISLAINYLQKGKIILLLKLNVVLPRIEASSSEQIIIYFIVLLLLQKLKNTTKQTSTFQLFQFPRCPVADEQTERQWNPSNRILLFPFEFGTLKRVYVNFGQALQNIYVGCWACWRIGPIHGVFVVILCRSIIHMRQHVQRNLLRNNRNPVMYALSRVPKKTVSFRFFLLFIFYLLAFLLIVEEKCWIFLEFRFGKCWVFRRDCSLKFGK